MISENTIQSRVILMCVRHRKAACHRLREMNRYTKQQRFFIAAWQECYQSNVLTKRKFRQKFGCKVPVPTTSTIMNIHRKAAETGTLEDEVRSGRPRLSGSRENLDRLHQSLVEDPHLSVRARARETGIPRESVRRLLRNDLQAYPFRPKILQLLSEEDKAMRLVFCDEMSTILENDATFLDQLVFTDEANFHLNGAVNRHNCRYWATENPNFIISEPLHSPHTTVWAGVWAGGFIGPFFHDQTVNGERYLTMLETDVLPVLETIEEFRDGRLWWQQDGAPPHWYRPAREILDNHFPERWLGRSGPFAWPARSPDLTACDYWLWGHLKQLVYRRQPENMEDLKIRIRAAFAEVTADVRQRAIAEFERRLRLC